MVIRIKVRAHFVWFPETFWDCCLSQWDIRTWIVNQNKKKTVLRKVCSIRKLNKYSLLQEKVLKLPYVSRLLPLHQGIKLKATNCKLCAWHNVQIKTKIFEFEVTCACWLGKEYARVNIQTEQILGVYRKAKRVLSPPGCNVLCLKITLVSKRRLLWILHRHLIYQITRTRLCLYADVRNPLWLPRCRAQFTVAFCPLMKRQQPRNVWEFK